jgi:hypothetical protein
MRTFRALHLVDAAHPGCGARQPGVQEAGKALENGRSAEEGIAGRQEGKGCAEEAAAEGATRPNLFVCSMPPQAVLPIGTRKVLRTPSLRLADERYVTELALAVSNSAKARSHSGAGEKGAAKRP